MSERGYFLDGYFSDPEELADAIKRTHAAGWTLLAVIPPGLRNEHGQEQGAAVLWTHESEAAPPWER